LTAQDVSAPQAGFFRHRLVSRGVFVGVRIYFDQPVDPVTGERLDRSYRWQCDVDGEPFADWDRIWPGCTGDPISESEYQTICTRRAWARENAPKSGYAEPSRKLDLLSSETPLPF
jgi:hypothetical protein